MQLTVLASVQHQPDDAASDSGHPDVEAQVTDRTPKGPGREKRNASSRAQGAKRQAKRDSR